jgi:hypothetical protein
MRNGTILLLLPVALSLVAASTLQAQLTPDQQRQIEKMLQPPKFDLDPSKFPRPPMMPPAPQRQTPDWVKFLDRNPILAAPIVAAVLTLPILIIIGFFRIVLGLIPASCRGRDTGDGSASKTAKRVTVVVLLLVIGLAVAFIVYSVMNDSRQPRANFFKTSKTSNE